MNILATIEEKVVSLGLDKVAAHLGADKADVRAYIARSKQPSFQVCQKAVDTWFIESRPYRADHFSKLWENRGVCLLMSSYKSVHPLTHFAIVNLFDRSTMCYEQRSRDAMITRSRNHLARRFLRDTKAEWSLWIDDDLIPPYGNAQHWKSQTGLNIPDEFAGLNTVNRLLSWKRNLVGALYLDRFGQKSITAGFSRGIQVTPPHNSLFPVNYIGTGCLLVHRQVYLDIAKKFPETYNPEAPGNECGFFTNIQEPNGRMKGEDESFGWRAAQVGHQSHIDLGLICGHVGDKIYGLE